MTARTTLLTLAWFASVTLADSGGPTIRLMLQSGACFSSGTTIDADEYSVKRLDLVLHRPLADVDPDSVTLSLNGTEIVGFAQLSRMSGGFRLVVDREAVRHRHLEFRKADNQLQFKAADTAGNRYTGQWRIHLPDGMQGARAASRQVASVAVLQKRQRGVPEIKIKDPPEVSRIAGARRKMQARIQGEVSDAHGVHSIAIYLNGKELERIQVRNGFPSRRRGNFRTSDRLPGRVDGDGTHLDLDIPVPLPKSVNVVTIRVANREGRQVSRTLTILRSN